MGHSTSHLEHNPPGIWGSAGHKRCSDLAQATSLSMVLPFRAPSPVSLGWKANTPTAAGPRTSGKGEKGNKAQGWGTEHWERPREQQCHGNAHGCANTDVQICNIYT